MKSVLFSFLLLLYTMNIAIAEPRMLISEKSFDFGYVTNNSRSSHTFWIKSVGEDTLKIERIIPGCGCTKVPLKKKEIPPGDSVALEVIFSSGQIVGKTIKNPTIMTNEILGKRRITFYANVTHYPETLHPITFSPRKLFVSRAGNVEISNAKFSLKNVSDQDLQLSLVSEPVGYFTVDFPKIIKAGETAQCMVTLHKEHFEEAFQKSITFEASDKKKTRITIPIVRKLIGTKNTEK